MHLQAHHVLTAVCMWTLRLRLREIDPILAILRSVLQCGTIRPSQIGILTPYDAQKVRLRNAVNETFVSLTVGNCSFLVVQLELYFVVTLLHDFWDGCAGEEV